MIDKETVLQQIKEKGYAVFAIADVGECLQCDAEGGEHTEMHDYVSKTHTVITDGYVYSVGFHNLGYPEVIVLAGPCGEEGDKVLSTKQLKERVQSAAALINHLYQNLSTYKPDPKRAINSDSIENLYWVLLNQKDKKFKHGSKALFMHAANGFHGHMNYDVLTFKAHIRS
jgi:hypothetical protein